MALGFENGRMDRCTKESGEKGNEMAKASIDIPTVMNTTGSGGITSHTDLAGTPSRQVVHTKASSMLELLMALAFGCGMMDQCMKENGKEVFAKAKVNIDFPAAINMMGSGGMTNRTDAGDLSSTQVVSLWASSRTGN